mgnify:CR=1 FL=1
MFDLNLIGGLCETVAQPGVDVEDLVRLLQHLRSRRHAFNLVDYSLQYWYLKRSFRGCRVLVFNTSGVANACLVQYTCIYNRMEELLQAKSNTQDCERTK